MSRNKWIFVVILIALAAGIFLRHHRIMSHSQTSINWYAATPANVPSLAWPLDCYKGENGLVNIGCLDIDNDGRDFNCDPVAIRGHAGTDIGITQESMDRGVKLYAAADGVVQWVFDGSYDRCPSDSQDCQAPNPKMLYLAKRSSRNGASGRNSLQRAYPGLNACRATSVTSIYVALSPRTFLLRPSMR